MVPIPKARMWSAASSSSLPRPMKTRRRCWPTVRTWSSVGSNSGKSMTSPAENPAQALVADLFRRESGRLIALLANRVGVSRIDLVEDAVQDALVSAMRSWSINSVPGNPSGWLYTAARNALLDRLRRARFEAPEAASDELTMPADD